MSKFAALTDVSDHGLVDVGPLVRATRLRNVLRANTVLSGVSGVVAAATAGFLGGLVGVSTTAARVVGIGLIVFAIDVALASGARHRHLPVLARLIGIADVAWVLATIVVVGSGTLTGPGVAIADVVGVIVACFALLELRGAAAVQAAGPVADEIPPLEAITVAAEVDAPTERAWAVVTDHELYGRLAPNLGRVEINAANGPGLARRCYDGRGRGWNESCTLWDEGRRFAVAVDTGDCPYPLRIMRGSWSVDPLGVGRSRFGMTFVFQPRRGVRGRAFAWMMQAAFPVVLRRILRGWREAATS